MRTPCPNHPPRALTFVNDPAMRFFLKLRLCLLSVVPSSFVSSKIEIAPDNRVVQPVLVRVAQTLTLFGHNNSYYCTAVAVSLCRIEGVLGCCGRLWPLCYGTKVIFSLGRVCSVLCLRKILTSNGSPKPCVRRSELSDIDYVSGVRSATLNIFGGVHVFGVIHRFHWVVQVKDGLICQCRFPSQ